MHLIEAVFAIAVQALLSAALVQQVAALAVVASQAERSAHTRQVASQIERLVHVARNSATTSADITMPVTAIADERLTFHADLDGNGRIDTHSSEAIGLYLRRDRDNTRLMHRIGRQSMALTEGANPVFSLTVRDTSARITHDPTQASLLGLSWGTSDRDQTISWFALPRRLP